MNDANHDAPPCAPSSRSRVIGFDWYDGVTEGIAANDHNDDAISFQLLARNFEPNELFVFRIVRLKDGFFADVLRELEPLGPPRWPVWVPLWKFDDPQEQARIDLFLEKSSIANAPTACVVVCEHILQPYLSKRAIIDQPQREEVEILRAIGISFKEWVDYVADRRDVSSGG